MDCSISLSQVVRSAFEKYVYFHQAQYTPAQSQRRQSGVSLYHEAITMCKFGKYLSGNLPRMLVTFGSLSLLFAWRIAPQVKEGEMLHHKNCKEITI